MKALRFMHLLSEADIELVFSAGALYERHSFFVLNSKTQAYDIDNHDYSFLETAALVRREFLAGQTIIVKNLEGFTLSLRTAAASLGANVDVHMYLVPPTGGASFPFHVDDRDVHLVMVYGTKEFIVRNPEGERVYLLNEGERLFIPKGVEHRAKTLGASCLLSFGVKADDNYAIYGGITAADLDAILRDV